MSCHIEPQSHGTGKHTKWVCTEPVGIVRLETRTDSSGAIVRRRRTVTRVGRLPWCALVNAERSGASGHHRMTTRESLTGGSR